VIANGLYALADKAEQNLRTFSIPFIKKLLNKEQKQQFKK